VLSRNSAIAAGSSGRSSSPAVGAGCSDAVQPGPQRRAPVEPRVAAPGAHEGLLDEVFRVLVRAKHAVAVREQLTPVHVGQLGELGELGERRCLGHSALNPPSGQQTPGS
jgi:hypothetical protein